MKNIIRLFFLFCLFAGCKSWDISKIAVKKDPISPRLLTLDKKMEDIENVAIISSDDRSRVFSKEVEEKFGITPLQMVDYKAMIGDPSDNIPGIAGIGPKTASALLQKYLFCL